MDYPLAKSPEELGFKNILYTKKDGVATLTINRPEVHNALNFPTMKEMSRAFEDASYDDAIGVLVLTGAEAAARVALPLAWSLFAASTAVLLLLAWAATRYLRSPRVAATMNNGAGP